MVNSTEARDIALYYISKSGKQMQKSEIVKNIAIAKSIMNMGYTKEEITVAIDLYVDKMYSLGFVKCVIADVKTAIDEQKKKEAIEEAKKRLNSEPIIHTEVADDGANRNREKLERGNNVSRVRKSNPFDNLK